MKKILLYTLVITTLTIRFFTEMPQWSGHRLNFSLLPRIFNLVDIMLLLIFVAFMLSYFAITNKKIKGVGIGKYVVLFTAILIVSICLNSKQIYWKAALSYIFMNLEAIIFALIIVNLDYKEEFFKKIVRLFLLLGMIQLLIALGIQLPLSWSKSGFSNPDIVSGTFGDNNSQLCFFLILFTLLILGRYMWEQSKKHFLLILVPVFITFYAAGF